MTTSAPITLQIYSSEKAVSELLIGQTALGEIVSKAMLEFYSLSELRKMQRGQMTKYNSIINKVKKSFAGCITRRTDLYNFFARNGKHAYGTEHIYVVSDEDAKMVGEIAALEVANAA